MNIILPRSVEYEVLETESVVKGQTASGSFKPATIQNGLKIMVPAFINQGDKIIVDTDNKAFFTVTNTGKKPLIIENVSASCGCTTPKKPEKPIPPGKSDRIEVGFHPRDGQLDAQEKSITVSANTDSKMEVLKIKAFVLPK